MYAKDERISNEELPFRRRGNRQGRPVTAEEAKRLVKEYGYVVRVIDKPISQEEMDQLRFVNGDYGKVQEGDSWGEFSAEEIRVYRHKFVYLPVLQEHEGNRKMDPPTLSGKPRKTLGVVVDTMVDYDGSLDLVIAFNDELGWVVAQTIENGDMPGASLHHFLKNGVLYVREVSICKKGLRPGTGFRGKIPLTPKMKAIPNNAVIYNQVDVEVTYFYEGIDPKFSGMSMEVQASHAATKKIFEWVKIPCLPKKNFIPHPCTIEKKENFFPTGEQNLQHKSKTGEKSFLLDCSLSKAEKTENFSLSRQIFNAIKTRKMTDQQTQDNQGSKPFDQMLHTRPQVSDDLLGKLGVSGFSVSHNSSSSPMTSSSSAPSSNMGGGGGSGGMSDQQKSYQPSYYPQPQQQQMQGGAYPSSATSMMNGLSTQPHGQQQPLQSMLPMQPQQQQSVMQPQYQPLPMQQPFVTTQASGHSQPIMPQQQVMQPMVPMQQPMQPMQALPMQPQQQQQVMQPMVPQQQPMQVAPSMTVQASGGASTASTPAPTPASAPSSQSAAPSASAAPSSDATMQPEEVAFTAREEMVNLINKAAGQAKLEPALYAALSAELAKLDSGLGQTILNKGKLEEEVSKSQNELAAQRDNQERVADLWESTLRATLIEENEGNPDAMKVALDQFNTQSKTKKGREALVNMGIYGMNVAKACSDRMRKAKQQPVSAAPLQQQQSLQPPLQAAPQMVGGMVAPPVQQSVQSSLQPMQQQQQVMAPPLPIEKRAEPVQSSVASFPPITSSYARSVYHQMLQQKREDQQSRMKEAARAELSSFSAPLQPQIPAVMAAATGGSSGGYTFIPQQPLQMPLQIQAGYSLVPQQQQPYGFQPQSSVMGYTPMMMPQQQMPQQQMQPSYYPSSTPSFQPSPMLQPQQQQQPYLPYPQEPVNVQASYSSQLYGSGGPQQQPQQQQQQQSPPQDANRLRLVMAERRSKRTSE